MSTCEYSTVVAEETRGSGLKVLHLISGRDAGGARTHVLSLLRELGRTEEVCLACLGPGPAGRDAVGEGIPCAVVEGGFLYGLRQVRALMGRGGYQILHCHGSRANLTGALLRPVLGVPVISTVHSDYRLDYLGRPWAALLLGTLNAAALRRMDGLVCVSRAMMDTCRGRGFSPEKLYCIYNGTDPHRPRKETDRLAWFRARGCAVEEGDVVAGIAARLHPVKDLPLLLRGFALAAAEVPQLKLVIAGSGSEEKALRRLAAELGLTGRVFFPGWVEDMEGFYASVDINVLTSRSETFPYAITDGARYARPVAATRVGGIPELIRHGETGLLFPPGDAAALGRALAALGRSEGLRHRLGEALRVRVAEGFTLQAMGETQRAIYRQALLPRRGIVVSGACGMGNVGDEAMLETLLRHIREADPLACVTVLSRTPEDTARAYGVESVQALWLPKVGRALGRARLLVSGGGNLLQDFTSRRSLWYYLHIIHMASRRGCRAVLYGCGLGPLSPRGEKAAGRVLARRVTGAVLRDAGSLAVLSRLCPELPAVLGGELALGVEPVPPAELDRLRRRLGLSPEGRWAAICPRPWPGTEKLLPVLAEEGARLWREEGLTPVLVALNVREDAGLCRRLAEMLAGVPYRRVEQPLAPGEAAALLGRMERVITMRLHGAAFAVSGGAACVGIACDGRMEAFLGPLGLPWLTPEQTDPPALRRAVAQAGGRDPALARRVQEMKDRLETGRKVLEREIADGTGE